MKRKLSLLLAVVLAMTMVMGIGVTAFAASFPDTFVTDEATEDYDSGFISHTSESQLISRVSTESSYTAKTYIDDQEEGVLTETIESSYGPVNYEIESLEALNGIGSYISATRSGASTKPISRYFWDNSTQSMIHHYYTEEYYEEHYGHTDTPDPSPCSPSAPAHVHKFEWQIITNPTKDTDGLEGEMCSCGAMRNTEKISAYAYSLYQYAMPMINRAVSGQTITFEFGEWNSFPKAFMEKIAAKSMEGVTFVFRYKWNHEKQEITIPFGTAVDTQFDWYGPAKMAELYGMN